MAQFKKNDLFHDFNKNFPNDSVCYAKIWTYIWNRGIPICSFCDFSGEPLFFWKRGKIRCKRCRRETSFTCGTIFYRSKLSIQKWFLMIWVWTFSTRYVSAKKLSKKTKIPYTTVFDSLHKLRKNLTPPKGEKLCGKIELDLLYVSKNGVISRYDDQKKSEYVILVVTNARSLGAGQVRIYAVKVFSIKFYRKCRIKNIARRASVTFGKTLYENVNPRIRFPSSSLQLQRKYSSTASIEVIGKELEEWLTKQFNGMVLAGKTEKQLEYFQGYLNEFCFRRNYRYRKGRKIKGYLFSKVLEHAVQNSAIEEGKKRYGQRMSDSLD